MLFFLKKKLEWDLKLVNFCTNSKSSTIANCENYNRSNLNNRIKLLTSNWFSFIFFHTFCAAILTCNLKDIVSDTIFFKLLQSFCGFTSIFVCMILWELNFTLLGVVLKISN